MVLIIEACEVIHLLHKHLKSGNFFYILSFSVFLTTPGHKYAYNLAALILSKLYCVLHVIIHQILYFIFYNLETALVLGDIPKIPYTGVSKSIPLYFLLIPRYRNSN